MKYNNKSVTYNGMKFDSQFELHRYRELELLQRAGEIKDLQRQVKFELIPAQKGERACYYIADYVYTAKGQKVAEDAKGVATKDYIIKRKLFKHKYPEYKFVETRMK